jgi:glycosyltransferase involved in cell wall biosynthesis
MNKLRVLYILHHFPQISETYIRSEIEALQDGYDLRIVSLNRADYPYSNHAPFCLTDDPSVIEQIIDDFQPDVLHTHWLQQTRLLAYFGGYFGARKRNIPFTVRTHSFDILEHDAALMRQSADVINSDLCLGILAFPFARSSLEKAGIQPDRIHDCYPVVNYERFHDASPNGDAVMNVGACLPKKKMEDYLKLATIHSQRRFNLYALGYDTPEMTRLNAAQGNPVQIVPPVEPEDMPGEYKRHQWLVYTASRKMNSVGWPMAVAEAQSAGVGVCLPNIRPDLRDYVGDAGFLYNSIDDVANLLQDPFPEEMRQRGFEQAKRSDIGQHKRILTDLWHTVSSPSAAWQGFISCPGSTDRWGSGTTVLEKRDRLRRARQELADLIPEGTAYILVDEDALGRDFVPGRRALLFLERNGQPGGPPENDNCAVREIERLEHEGAQFLAFAWPAFWWLEHYTELRHYLFSNFSKVVDNERLLIFDLAGSAACMDQASHSNVSRQARATFGS